MKPGRVPIILLLAGLLAGAPRTAAGFSFFQYGGYLVVWPGSQSLRYLSPTVFPPGSETEFLILGAMGLWNLVPAAEFEYFYYTLDQDYPVDHFDGFNDTTAYPAAWLDPGVLGVTYMVNDGPYWFDMDLIFSDLPEGVGWTFDTNPDCDTVANPTPSNGFSFLLVATHELGHAAGLGHDPFGNEPPGTPWFVATMNPSYPAGGPVGQENIIELHTDDRNGLRFLYPHSGPSGPPLVDLANASCVTGGIVGKPVPAFFSPDAVPPSGQIVARSLIENFGTTNEFFVRQGFFLSPDPWITTADQLLGTLTWDIAFGDLFEFDVLVPIPADLPAGPRYLGSILDDLDQINETYEDNNAAVYCLPLTIQQLVPAINPLPQQSAACGQPFVGSAPSVTHPLNMAPITWSLDNPEPGMTVNPATGVISWPQPVPSPFLYTLNLRATNSAGSTVLVVYLGVNQAVPQIAPIPDESIFCAPDYTGPTPTITAPACVEPITAFSLDAGPPGMTINGDTGVVTWTAPVSSPTPYTITIRAINAAGSGTATWQLLYTRDGDLDRNGTVNLADFATFGLCFGATGSARPPSCSADDFACCDLDGDATVDLADFATFAVNFGS